MANPPCPHQHPNHDTTSNNPISIPTATASSGGCKYEGGNNSKFKYKGVRQSCLGKWVAEIGLGTFATAEAAASAYDRAATMLYGSRAQLNFQQSPNTTTASASATVAISGPNSANGNNTTNNPIFVPTSSDAITTTSKYEGDKAGPDNNKIKYKGVRQRRRGQWTTEIREPGKKSRRWLGAFATAEDAARAYDDAAILLFGSKAKVNFARSVAVAPPPPLPPPPPTLPYAAAKTLPLPPPKHGC